MGFVSCFKSGGEVAGSDRVTAGVGSGLWNTVKGRAILLGVTLASAGAPALAAPTPVTLDEIEFPMTISSIVSAIAVAGGTMLAAWAGLYVGFRLIRALIRRVAGVV